MRKSGGKRGKTGWVKPGGVGLQKKSEPIAANANNRERKHKNSMACLFVFDTSLLNAPSGNKLLKFSEKKMASPGPMFCKILCFIFF